MHRLDRRRIILEGKRQGAFDSNQYYFEKSSRTRVTRRARVLLRGGRPLSLVTPRWSSPQGFLDDLATDLALGEPCIKARSLGLTSLKGLTVHQAWAWLASAVAEFCQVTMIDEDGSGKPLWQAVSRRGFREVMTDLLRRAEGGRRRCLMIHGLEHAPMEAVQDLIEVFADHIKAYGPDRVVNFVFAGSVDAPYLELDGAVRLHLDDFSEAEAMEMLVEFLGVLPENRLRGVIGVIGGVPAFLEALAARGGDDLVKILMDREALWAALGRTGDEVRNAIDIANCDAELARRLERLARLGSLPEEPQDQALSKAGLVTLKTHRYGADATMRNRWFSDLVLSS